MAFTTLEAIVAQLQSYAATLSGIRAAPAKPPDHNGVFPFAVSGIESIQWDITVPGEMLGLATFYTEIHHAMLDSARDFEMTIPYGLSYPNKLWSNPTLGGNISTIRGRDEGGSGVLCVWRNDMTYAGVNTVGWYITLSVKIHYILT